MRIIPRPARISQTLAFALCLWAAAGTALAQQPPAGGGGFMSSLTQAFRQDLARDVVRGHFDVGSAPDTHRYYCLVDPKSGRNEPNGVAGEPVKRRDGMTGIKGGAVSPWSCADAERNGLLVTEGYSLKGVKGRPHAMPGSSAEASAGPGAGAGPAVPPARPVSAAPSIAAPPSGTAATAAPSAPATAAPPPAVMPPMMSAATAGAGSVRNAAGAAQSEVTALFARFIAGQNAHDAAAVADLLLDSRDFVWVQSGGGSIWGRREAMDAFEHDWKGAWRLEPQLNELRVASVSPDAAVLVTPLLLTSGNPGEDPNTVPLRWAGVFVRTAAGWRISSIFTTPYKAWRAPAEH